MAMVVVVVGNVQVVARLGEAVAADWLLAIAPATLVPPQPPPPPTPQPITHTPHTHTTHPPTHHHTTHTTQKHPLLRAMRAAQGHEGRAAASAAVPIAARLPPQLFAFESLVASRR